MARRKPREPVAEDVATIVLNIPGVTLPPWTPPAPRDGWTVESAADAAIDYAIAEAPVDRRQRRRTALRAFQALLDREGLRHAEIASRVRGVDVWAHALYAADLGERPRTPAAFMATGEAPRFADADLPFDDDDAPF